MRSFPFPQVPSHAFSGGVGALFDEVQAVSGGHRLTGEIACVNHISVAMPRGLSLQIQFSRGFRRLNPDAILSVSPGSEPRIQRRGWIEVDRTNVLGSNPTGSRTIVLRQISTSPFAFDSIHQDRIARR